MRSAPPKPGLFSSEQTARGTIRHRLAEALNGEVIPWRAERRRPANGPWRQHQSFCVTALVHSGSSCLSKSRFISSFSRRPTTLCGNDVTHRHPGSPRGRLGTALCGPQLTRLWRSRDRLPFHNSRKPSGIQRHPPSGVACYPTGSGV